MFAWLYSYLETVYTVIQSACESTDFTSCHHKYRGCLTPFVHFRGVCYMLPDVMRCRVATMSRRYDTAVARKRFNYYARTHIE